MCTHSEAHVIDIEDRERNKYKMKILNLGRDKNLELELYGTTVIKWDIKKSKCTKRKRDKV